MVSAWNRATSFVLSLPFMTPSCLQEYEQFGIWIISFIIYSIPHSHVEDVLSSNTYFFILSFVRPTPVRFSVLQMSHSNSLPGGNTSIGINFLSFIWLVYCIALFCSLVFVKRFVFLRKLFLDFSRKLFA